jgi:hypothetical protein
MGVLSKLDGLFLVVRSDMHISACSDTIGRVEVEFELELRGSGGGGGSM